MRGFTMANATSSGIGTVADADYLKQVTRLYLIASCKEDPETCPLARVPQFLWREIISYVSVMPMRLDLGRRLFSVVEQWEKMITLCGSERFPLMWHQVEEDLWQEELDREEVSGEELETQLEEWGLAPAFEEGCETEEEQCWREVEYEAEYFRWLNSGCEGPPPIEYPEPDYTERPDQVAEAGYVYLKPGAIREQAISQPLREHQQRMNDYLSGNAGPSSKKRRFECI
jgi:hypothetical protein